MAGIFARFSVNNWNLVLISLLPIFIMFLRFGQLDTGHARILFAFSTSLDLH